MDFGCGNTACDFFGKAVVVYFGAYGNRLSRRNSSGICRRRLGVYGCGNAYVLGNLSCKFFHVDIRFRRQRSFVLYRQSCNDFIDEKVVIHFLPFGLIYHGCAVALNDGCGNDDSFGYFISQNVVIDFGRNALFFPLRNGFRRVNVSERVFKLVDSFGKRIENTLVLNGEIFDFAL